MWVFTRDGFFSIVEHHTDPDLMCVRARSREDLVRVFGTDGIVRDATADYRYRVFVPCSEVSAYVAESVANIDYTTSVKDVISRTDPSRKRALYRVWHAMWDWQEGHT